MLFLLAFNVPLAEFTCILWVIILHEYKSLNPNQTMFQIDHMMLQYTVIANQIQFALYLVLTPNFAISKSPPPPP